MRMTEKLLADFKENSGKWDKELENIQVQQDNSQNMIRQLEDKVTAKEAEVKAAEAKAVEQLDEYDSIKTQAEALSEEITAARIAATSSENKKNNAEQMAERIKAALDEIKNDCEDKKGQLTNLDIEHKYLESEAVNMESELTSKGEEKENLNRYLSELTEERAATGNEMIKLSSEKEAFDKQVTAFQNQKYEMEIKVAKNETQLDAFKDKLWEDFELSYIQAMEFKKEEFNVALAAKENRQLRSRMKALGDVNIGAIAEYEKENERYEFLSGQRADILEATESLKQIIEDMDKTIKSKFKESFDQVVVHFEEIFKQLFGGGHAELRLDDENNPLEAGIDIIAQPPGKKLQNINLLSGGEKTMTAIALMFAVLKTKPTPFCILDEVEAALDDANIERFAKYLKTFDDIQFTLVTHQKATMEHADVLYGVTMPERGISKVLSLRLGDDFSL
jgi:chromosome segregation protein